LFRLRRGVGRWEEIGGWELEKMSSLYRPRIVVGLSPHLCHPAIPLLRKSVDRWLLMNG